MDLLLHKSVLIGLEHSKFAISGCEPHVILTVGSGVNNLNWVVVVDLKRMLIVEAAASIASCSYCDLACLELEGLLLSKIERRRDLKLGTSFQEDCLNLQLYDSYKLAITCQLIPQS